MKRIVCPVSSERVNENVVRFTALQVVLLMGVFMLTQFYLIPLFLMVDFFLRAFTRTRLSPLSWISNQVLTVFSMSPAMIDKAPKIFAARIGFVFSLVVSLLSIAGMATPALIVASVLAIFAFLECGVNFCAGCWVYTYIVLPLYGESHDQ